MRFVETGEDVRLLLDVLSEGECFMHLHWRYELHPANNEPLTLMIHHYETNGVYIISFSHPDCITTELHTLQLVANTPCRKYVLNRKDMLHIVDMQNCVDVGLGVYADSLNNVEFEKFRCKDTRSVPIMQLLKSFKVISKLVYSSLHMVDDNMIKYESEFSCVLKEVEESGIYVNNFNLGDTSLIDESGLVYSQYNMRTPAGRPSNRFGGVNYAALNKTTGDRDCFVSRYGEDGAIVMMDYESYHLRLFGNHVNFELPKESLHTYLGKLYHGKDELTEDEYDLSKKITFNLIFGGITDDVRDNVPFMARISEFVDETWKFYKKHGYVETWFYNRKLKSSIFDDKTNAYKVFNYLLQSAETERNCRIMRRVLDYLRGKRTKFFLYTYDAFLFDMPRDEFVEVKKLAELMHENGEYPVRVEVGGSYGDLREVTF
jgi:hypothetical protein